MIPKNNNDPFGLEFEIALMKARYVYPAPDNPHAQDIVSHAKQIYESEMLERSLCAFYESIVPITYKTACEHLQDSLRKSGTPYTITKNKSETNIHKRIIYEYPYEFLDVLHVPSRKIIECKVYRTEESKVRHRRRILERRSYRRDNDPSDYYLLCEDKDSGFEVGEFLSINERGKFVRENFEEFINA